MTPGSECYVTDGQPSSSSTDGNKHVFRSIIMKFAALLLLFPLVLSGSLALSQLRIPAWLQRLDLLFLDSLRQAQIMPLPDIHLLGSSKQNGDSDPQGDPIISDVIGKERIVNIFAGFTRDVEAISSRLDDGTKNSTVLAPLNSEIQKLPRKPWEDPEDYNTFGESAYQGDGGSARAQRNLRRFVESHIVPSSPWVEGEKVNTLAGNQVWWESKDGKKLVSQSVLEIDWYTQERKGSTWKYRGG